MIPAHTHRYTDTHTHKYTHTHIHTQTHTHTHTHIHKYTDLSILQPLPGFSQSCPKNLQ